MHPPISKRINNFLNSFSNLNLAILVIVGLLCLIGMLSIYSASLNMEGSFFEKIIGRQLIWLVLSSLIAATIYFLQKKLIYDSAYILYLLGFGLLLLPYFFGKSVSGTVRWITLGSAGFQPSEFMKIMVMLAIARFIASTSYSNLDFKFVLIPTLLSLLPMAVVLKQPDLGTSIIYFGMLFPMLYWAGARLFHLFIIIAPVLSIVTAFNFYTFFIWVVIVVFVLYLTKEKLRTSLTIMLLNLSLGFTTPFLWNGLKPYQQQRILTLFNINADPQGTGYQVLQSKIAIGSGGLFGKGIARGTQTHLKFLPEQHTDFIFSVIGEEYGFIGVLVVLLLFLAFILICINIAYRQKDRFCSLCMIGIASIIGIHVIINVAMTIGLMPVTGLPLPFVSYGGSFLMTCFILVGLALNIGIDKQY
ncbi:MAG TPA: rod shape-determining protein RodA [Candidatus Marinimicrobia bacterium]|nr:rod shape-determining protein RodA [Candidatus Neomarinimicrobiota bacterium]HRS51377.1 rod shape-determining protein RodA [Candidatus Neomarinimicrobiota bacterium]HRU92251.1 rod shape-determining protein RodA [Candidatus Neomarinimicrobiota bacterium]